MKVLEEYERFKLLYSEIILGKSWCEEEKCWVKHFTNSDNAALIRLKNSYIERLKNEGIPSEKEKLETLYSLGAWTPKNEEKIAELRLCIADNEKNSQTMPVKSQREAIEKIINEKRKELSLLLSSRNQVVHPTTEYYGAKFYSELFPRFSLFLDDGLTTYKYTSKMYDDELSEEEIAKIHMAYLACVEKFNEKNITYLAALPIAINDVSFCRKNILNFLGKPVTQFTNFQQELVSRTLRNLNILENADGEPPEIHEETTLNDISDWYDLNYSVIQGRKNASTTNNGEIKMSKEYVKR